MAAWFDQALVAQLREGQPARDPPALRAGVSGARWSGSTRKRDTVTRELEVDVKFDQLPKPLVIGEEGQVEIDAWPSAGPASAPVGHFGEKRRQRRPGGR